MSKLNEYLNSLEGQENVDPLEVARTMHELHTEELGTREAKIAELQTTVAGKEGELSQRDQEIAKWKAKNFDLAMQIPGDHSDTPKPTEDEKPTGSNIRIGDLFADNVRKRHGI